MSTLLLIGSLVALIVLLCWLGGIEEARRLRHVAEQRQNDSICTFARALDYRRLDTKVIRVVYEELQGYFEGYVPNFPFRVSDNLTEDFKIDEWDIDDLVCEIAERTGRRLDNCDANPYREKVQTIGDVIHFLCAQPKVNSLSKST
jgi:hypothetical protein